MPDIKEMATRPIGPLPAFAWVLVIVGGYFGYRILNGRTSSSTTSTTVGADTSGTPGAADTLTLQTQLNNLTQSIADLSNKITGTTGTSTTSSTGYLLATEGPGQKQQVGLLDITTGKVVAVASERSYTLGNAITTKLGAAHLVTQNGKTYALLDRNFSTTATAVATAAAAVTTPAVAATQAVGTTTQQTLSVIASAPKYSNNTATPTPVAIASPILKGVNNIASLPTMGTENVAAKSLNIPATTPKVSAVVAKAAPVTAKVKAAPTLASTKSGKIKAL